MRVHAVDDQEDATTALVAAAARGERDALDTLLTLVMPDIRQFCRTRLGGFPDPVRGVDDAVQEVALALVPAVGRYRPQLGSWQGFVQGVVRNKVGDVHRAWYRSRTWSGDEPGERAATDPGPEELILQAEQAVELDRLLEELPPRQRQILVMRVGAGMSATEVAERLGTTPGAVRTAQHRALNALRAAVAGGERG